MADTFEIQNLPRSCNEMLILAALRDGAKHGYQIALEIEERSGGFFAVNHGTLYPILHQLEKEAMIEGRWSEGESRRKRKEYLLTGAGQEHLRRRQEEWKALCRKLSTMMEKDQDA